MPEQKAIRAATTRVWWRKSDDEGRIFGVRAGCLSVEANLRSRLCRRQKAEARQRRAHGGGKAMTRDGYAAVGRAAFRWRLNCEAGYAGAKRQTRGNDARMVEEKR